jgi:Uma2 family endonuclease
MSTLAIPTSPATVRFRESAAPPANAARFTLEQYHQMIDAGVFAHDERFELLDGFVVHKMTRNPPHDFSMLQLQKEFFARLSDKYECRQQSAITLAVSEPEPDLCVAIGPSRRYVDHHPGKDEVRLVCEVSDSTLRDDRGIKLRIYAEAGLSEYWIVNIPGRQVEVYTDPTGPELQPSYRIRRDFHLGDRVPVVLDGQSFGEIAVSDLIAG